MKKTREQKRKEIILDFLDTKFRGKKLEMKILSHNSDYYMYFLGKTEILNAWRFSEKTNFRATFDKKFLEEFARWFPKFKYKRRILRDWLFENYDIVLPEGCILYVP